ncbi:MAG: NAD(P)-binding protein, partial [Pseudomonadota bacterium]
PPGLTGLRGSHKGSFEVAHALVREGRRDWGPVEMRDSSVYDLVVVGAGISGLAAAYFYYRENPEARILILDNHDDFGGHAKRNEFTVDGKKLLGYGGSQTFEEPSEYDAISAALLEDLGIDMDRFYQYYDQEFYRRHGLAGGVFFGKENWGADQLANYDLGGLRYSLPLANSDQSVEEAVAAMPMSAAAKAQMLRLLTHEENVFPGMSAREVIETLENISYRDYLQEYLGITEPEVFASLQALTTDLGADIGAVPAGSALRYIGLPGYEATGLPELQDSEPYIHHFPDGNASMCRLMVRRMIPAVASGSTMDDIVQANFDYSKLDRADSLVRMRLKSTVVKVVHDGDPKSAKTLTVQYVQGGALGQVSAKACVMACYNAIIPSICTELPQSQKDALAYSMKVPILYTNVALRNWRAWEKLGIGAVSCPGAYHVNAMLDFPVSMGGYQFSDSSDEPIVVHMERFPHVGGKSLSKREQAPLGRIELLTTPFETIERNTREQLGALLGPGGFDPANDIAAITVNRWAHGYATRDWLEDTYYEDPSDERYWYVKGRKPLGRIAIANTDAGAFATVDTAIAQAHRAISELM